MNDTEKYQDIIDLPHHQSKTHPHMSNSERAAQFSPFAALKGYEDEIEETARWTDEFRELDDAVLSIINEKLVCLKEKEREHPRISVCYFEQDVKKSGGSYLTVTGNIKKIDEYHHKIILEDGKGIPFENLIEIDLEDSE
ncbi:MAG: YolD-like family protein [Clostridia bacterium]|nr:YolD-like family protein [Clostridia bacterium]